MIYPRRRNSLIAPFHRGVADGISPRPLSPSLRSRAAAEEIRMKSQTGSGVRFRDTAAGSTLHLLLSSSTTMSRTAQLCRGLQRQQRRNVFAIGNAGSHFVMKNNTHRAEARCCTLPAPHSTPSPPRPTCPSQDHAHQTNAGGVVGSSCGKEVKRGRSTIGQRSIPKALPPPTIWPMWPRNHFPNSGKIPQLLLNRTTLRSSRGTKRFVIQRRTCEISHKHNHSNHSHFYEFPFEIGTLSLAI